MSKKSRVVMAVVLIAVMLLASLVMLSGCKEEANSRPKFLSGTYTYDEDYAELYFDSRRDGMRFIPLATDKKSRDTNYSQVTEPDMPMCSGVFSKDNVFNIDEVRVEVFFGFNDAYRYDLDEQVLPGYEVYLRNAGSGDSKIVNYYKVRDVDDFSDYNYSLNRNGKIETLGDYRHREIVKIPRQMFPNESGYVEITFSSSVTISNGETYDNHFGAYNTAVFVNYTKTGDTVKLYRNRDSY